MKTLSYRSRASEVFLLEEILSRLGYDIFISDYFGMDTHHAVLDFQHKNGLVVDGKVGVKTWSKLLAEDRDSLDFNYYNFKFNLLFNMKTLSYRSRASEVFLLEEILSRLGYDIVISDYFGMDTHHAILDFQHKNGLVVDGKVGVKTWSKLLAEDRDSLDFNYKLLSEQDLLDFARHYNLEIAAVKAVNEVESSGKGFLLDGRPKILFEGHVFWRELKKRNIQPETLLNNHSKDILYKTWTKNYYSGGTGEYVRLEKAASLSPLKEVKEAAYCSASWGAFQIMGYHYSPLGYESIDSFVSRMAEHEREHLKAFGKFLEVNNLIRYLKSLNWEKFAEGYNGKGYRANKYDEKLRSAYERYLAL